MCSFLHVNRTLSQKCQINFFITLKINLTFATIQRVCVQEKQLGFHKNSELLGTLSCPSPPPFSTSVTALNPNSLITTRAVKTSGLSTTVGSRAEQNRSSPKSLIARELSIFNQTDNSYPFSGHVFICSVQISVILRTRIENNQWEFYIADAWGSHTSWDQQKGDWNTQKESLEDGMSTGALKILDIVLRSWKSTCMWRAVRMPRKDIRRPQSLTSSWPGGFAWAGSKD